MSEYVQMYYNDKLEKTTKNIWKLDKLKEKYNYYFYFSESVLNNVNNADLDITKKVLL